MLALAGVLGGTPGLQRSHLLGQSRNLRRQCLDPCLLRQHQRNQVLFRERKKGIAGHPNDGSCPPLAVKQKVQAVSMQHQIEEGEQLRKQSLLPMCSPGRSGLS